MEIFCKMQGTQSQCYVIPGGMGWGERWEGGVRRRGPMADSCWCMAEVITILQSNYLLIKNKIKF